MKVIVVLTLHIALAMAGRRRLNAEGQVATDDAVQGAVHSGAYASSETASFERATGAAASGVWVNMSTRQDCQVRANYWEWVGTAPFCKGTASDCTDRGMKVSRFGQHGSKCWSGKKVLCYKEKVTRHDDCNIFCNPGKFEYTMYGTAPVCDADDCDCWRQGEIPVGGGSQFSCPCTNPDRCPDEMQRDGNNKCWTGRKQFCVRPIFKTAMDLEMVKSCDFRYGEAEKTKRAAMDMVAELAKAGAEAAAASAAGR